MDDDLRAITDDVLNLMRARRVEERTVQLVEALVTTAYNAGHARGMLEAKGGS